MKISTLFKATLLLAITLTTSACVVRSLNPYYTKERLIETPVEIQGKWIAHKKSRPWVVGKNKIITYGKKNVASSLVVRFFKVNGVLYSDSLPGAPGDKAANEYWVFHVQPVHILSKVTYTNKTLVFQQISPAALDKLIKQHQLKLSRAYPDRTASSNVFIAKSADWIRFLEKFGTEPGLFKDTVKLTRQ